MEEDRGEGAKNTEAQSSSSWSFPYRRKQRDESQEGRKTKRGGPVDAPRSRSTRRSSTIGLESPVPVYGSGVRCFEQQADQVEASGRALDTVFEHARGKPARRSKSLRIHVVYFLQRREEIEDNEVEMEILKKK